MNQIQSPVLQPAEITYRTETEAGKHPVILPVTQRVQRVRSLSLHQRNKIHGHIECPVRDIIRFGMKILPVLRGKRLGILVLVIHVTIHHHLHVQLVEHFLINRSELQPLRETDHGNTVMITQGG